MGRHSMGRRPMTWDESDAFGAWRHVLCWVQRAGARKKVKQAANRRDRRRARREIRKELDE